MLFGILAQHPERRIKKDSKSRLMIRRYKS